MIQKYYTKKMKMMKKLMLGDTYIYICIGIRRDFSRFSWLKFFCRVMVLLMYTYTQHILGIIFRKKKIIIMWVWVYYFFWQCFSSFFVRRKIIICRLFVLIKKKIKKIVNQKKNEKCVHAWKIWQYLYIYGWLDAFQMYICVHIIISIYEFDIIHFL